MASSTTVNKSSPQSWDPEDDSLLIHLKEVKNLGWKQISSYFDHRTSNACQFRWRRLKSGQLKSSSQAATANSSNNNNTPNTSPINSANNNNIPQICFNPISTPFSVHQQARARRASNGSMDSTYSSTSRVNKYPVSSTSIRRSSSISSQEVKMKILDELNHSASARSRLAYTSGALSPSDSSANSSDDDNDAAELSEADSLDSKTTSLASSTYGGLPRNNKNYSYSPSAPSSAHWSSAAYPPTAPYYCPSTAPSTCSTSTVGMITSAALAVSKSADTIHSAHPLQQSPSWGTATAPRPTFRTSYWNQDEDQLLRDRVQRNLSFVELSVLLQNKSDEEIRNRIEFLEREKRPQLPKLSIRSLLDSNIDSTPVARVPLPVTKAASSVVGISQLVN
ncbi:unnamed protein product [Ambrosiozyma monospora]|uniref:Unnamed protein product n=1 Tax=Ambrosiozyma monospora TaxID=43982 RepID=A0ACB5T5C7_AMBMO|nr:unnamed protein product [Ambrosiozyma monospora]